MNIYRILIFLLAITFFIACEKRKAFLESPKELEKPVKEFFIQKGETLSNFRAEQYSDDIYLIKASTDKSDGWGLVAERKQNDGRTNWQIDVGTEDKLKSLGVAPEF